MPHNIRHTQTETKGSFYIEKDGEKSAEMTYSRAGETRVIFDHTEVSDTLRGTGAGKALISAAVEWARKDGLKVFPLCPFAKAIIERDKSLQDVL